MVLGGYDPAVLKDDERHVYTNTTVGTGWFVVQVSSARSEGRVLWILCIKSVFFNCST